MECLVKLKLDNGRTFAANIRAHGPDNAMRKADFLAFHLEQLTGERVSQRGATYRMRAPAFGFTTVNTRTGRIGGADLFELVFTQDAKQ